MGDLRVHILHRPEPEVLKTLEEALDPGICLTFGADLPADSDFSILVAGRPEEDHLNASPDLERLIIPWAGIPPETRDLCLRFDHLAVHNLHYNAAATAEMAAALLLAAAKFLVPMDQALRRGDWRPRYAPNPSLLLGGKTGLILGYGEIGRRLSRICMALEMRLRAIRSSLGDEDAPVKVYTTEALRQLLPETQVLMICLPHTPDTDRLIGERELALLPADALLINVARGGIVDERALYQALKEKTLAAAGLDVWYQYPADEANRGDTAPSRFPFSELENVVMSPHRGGGWRRAEVFRMGALAELLNAASRGEELGNRVDVSAGY